MAINYQLMLDKELEKIQRLDQRPRLLLHACCAPCSSYVLEYLSRYFDITVLFYNPNISSASEFKLRAKELQRLVKEMNLEESVTVQIAHYDSGEFFNIARGKEDMPEGGERCTECFRLRLSESARVAKEGNYDYFTTSLSISPLKDAKRLNTIGGEIAEQYGVSYLYSDFKKREGSKRSIQLSGEHNLYRQDYCGCVFSKRDAENRKKEQ